MSIANNFRTVLKYAQNKECMMVVADSDYIVLLGSKIARLRKMQGLNQFEFADKCGKMVNTISKIERGIGDPRLSTLINIAEALNISVTELLDSHFISPAMSRMTGAENVDSAIDGLLSQCDDETKAVVLSLLQLLVKK